MKVETGRRSAGQYSKLAASARVGRSESRRRIVIARAPDSRHRNPREAGCPLCRASLRECFSTRGASGCITKTYATLAGRSLTSPGRPD